MATKFWTVEAVKDHYYDSRRFETYADAEDDARRRVWSNGHDQVIMGQVALVKAPEEINTAKVVAI